MKTNRIVILCLILTAVVGTVIFFLKETSDDAIQPKGERTARLTVRVTGVSRHDATVRLAVFGDAESFKRKTNPVRRKTIKGNLVTSFEDLPTGEYAVAAYIDINTNNTLDKNAFGIPTEPYCFSNQAKGTFGPPSFRDAKIGLKPTGTSIELRFSK